MEKSILMSKFSKVLFFNLLILLAIGFSGCGSTADNTAKDNKSANNKPAATSEPEKKTDVTKPDSKSEDVKPDSKPETASTGDKIGVPECDEYIEKYEACVFSKVPEAARGAFKSSFEAQRKAWKDAAANPQSKAALASGCKQALETAKQALATYSCDW